MPARAPQADNSAEGLALQLERLRAQVDAARQQLAAVQADRRVAEAGLSETTANLLLEANERLVEGLLEAQVAADTTARAMLDLAQRGELDGLTGLPNRLLLMDRLTHAITQARRHGTSLAVMFIDLDRFKEINDRLGHAAGDQVLRFVARELVAAVRGSDTVSRHGGDEFLIVLHEVTAPGDAVHVAQKVQERLAAGCDLDGQHTALAASIGISHFPAEGDDADALIERADQAMYEAKRRRCGTFTPLVGAPGPTTVPAFRATHGELQAANEALVLAALDAQQLYEAAAQALKRQSDFIAMVAHELRGPLVPISNASQQLARRTVDETASHRLHAIIARQVTYLSRLVQDLFEGTRVRSGTLKMESIPIDFTDVIDDAIDATRPAMFSRQQSFLHVPWDGKLPLQGDRQRLVQALANLLDNASKYTPPGGTIRMAVSVPTGRNELVLTVTDNGIGISPHALGTVFDPFVQESRAAEFDPSGMGLGLTVAMTVVRGHGGTLVARSAGVGAGCEFELTLPLSAGAP